MKYVLLDGVAAGFFVIAFVLGLAFIIVVILLEAWIMKGLKYQDNFRKAFNQSSVANLLSLGSGFLVLRFYDGSEAPDLSHITGFAIYFAVTMVVEFLFLFLLNRAKPALVTLKACFLMNLVTYLIAYLVSLTFYY